MNKQLLFLQLPWSFLFHQFPETFEGKRAQTIFVTWDVNFVCSTMSQEGGILPVSKTCFTMATDGILETLATKYPQVIILLKAGYLWQRQWQYWVKESPYFGNIQGCKTG